MTPNQKLAVEAIKSATGWDAELLENGAKVQRPNNGPEMLVIWSDAYKDWRCQICLGVSWLTGRDFATPEAAIEAVLPRYRAHIASLAADVLPGWPRLEWEEWLNPRLATGTIESAKEALAAAHAELDRLRTVAESRLMRMRTASQLLIAEIGAKGAENVDITAGRAVAVIEALKDELTAARRGPVVEWRPIDNYPGGPDTVICSKGIFELWVVTEFPANYTHNRKVGWWIRVLGASVDRHDAGLSGPETGPAGKAAAEAAYRKAVGLA